MNIIELLGIQYKEDIISNLFVGLINESENFRIGFLENIVGIDNVGLYNVEAFTRIETSYGIPDIIIKISNDKESILVIVENKLKAEEGYEQTKRYSHEQCVKELCLSNNIKLDYDITKTNFIYLTLIPEQIPTGEKFINKIYKDLIENINVNIENVILDGVYKDFINFLKDFYSNLDMNEQDKILDLLCDNVDNEKIYIRFNNIMKLFKFNNGLKVMNVGKAGGTGRVSFIAQISKDNWRGNDKADFVNGLYNVKDTTYDIHLEFSFDILNKVIKLPLHYETNPYIPKNKLIKYSREEDYKKYIDRRELVKDKLHEKINNLDNNIIKTYNGSNQIASITINIGDNLTVEEFVRIIEKYCSETAILVDEVLCEVNI